MKSLLLVIGFLMACGQQGKKEVTSTHPAGVEEQEQGQAKTENAATAEASNTEPETVAESTEQGGEESQSSQSSNSEKQAYNHDLHYCQWFPESFDPEVDKLQEIGFNLVEAAKAIGILEEMETANSIRQQQLTRDLENLTVDVTKFYWETCKADGGLELTGIFQGVIDLLTGAWGLLATTLLGVIDLASYTLSQGVTIIHDSVYGVRISGK